MENSNFDLERFLEAQEGAYERALSELRSGRKRSHWMWFVFPQIRGLGRSAMSERYAIGSLEEARAYLAHPVLGRRLIEVTEAALASEAESANSLFGSPDDLKFRSSMTLFAAAAGEESAFKDALESFFGGVPDARTVALLKANEGD